MTHIAKNALLKRLAADTTLDAAQKWFETETAGTYRTGSQRVELHIRLREQLENGEYSLGVQRRVKLNGEQCDLWSQQDRIVLQALFHTLEPLLGNHVSRRCFHYSNRGGGKAALCEVRKYLEENGENWVMQNSVEGCYAHFNHHLLYRQLEKLLPGETFILRLLWQYMHRVVQIGDTFVDVQRGIPSGCSLSTLLASLYLAPLDRTMEESGFYVRFMDSWILIAPTRWKLYHAAKKYDSCLVSLGLERLKKKSPDIKKGNGCIFLGQQLVHHGFNESKGDGVHDFKTVNHGEQPVNIVIDPGYTPRWQKWARAGVGILAGGAMVAPATALGASIERPSLGGRGFIDLDYDSLTDLSLLYLGGCRLLSVSAPVGSAITSSVPFGESNPGLSQTNWGTGGSARYIRVRTTGGYYGWLTVAPDCTYSSFFGENPRVTELMPDGSKPSNDPPTATGIPADIIAVEDTASNLDLSTITFADGDGDSLTVTLSATSGTMVANAGGGVSVDGSGTSTLTLAGTAAAINTFLDTVSNIQYTSSLDVSGDDAATLTINANDGKVNPTLGSVNIDITPMNDAPTATGIPSDVAVVGEVGSDLDLSSVTFRDVDGDSLTVTLAASSGTIDATSGGGVVVDGSGTSTLTLEGTVASINTFLDTASTIQYTSAPGVSGNDAATLGINADDGTVNPNLGNVNIDITMNNAPTATGIPTDLTVVEDTGSNLDLSSVTFGDVDGDSLTVTLAASSGSMDATSGGGVGVDGSGSSTLTLTGTAASINTFLDTASNIQYTGALHLHGENAATLTINADDGKVNPILGSVNIDITSVNDAPTFTGTPAIIGDVRIGESLELANTATHDVDHDSVSLSYQWKADELSVGSNEATYILRAEDEGKMITCTLTADDGKGGVTVFTTDPVQLRASFSWNLFFPAILSKTR